MTPAERTQRLRQLNDHLRRKTTGGRFMLTAGVADLEFRTLMRAIHAVRTFEDFTPDNDRYGEHDFGSLEIDGVRLLWKIDCYDRALEFGSPDPTDPEVTTRVLTLMLPSEC